MENLALIDSFSEFKDDKLIDRNAYGNLEDVFRNALKKKNTVQTIISSL
jgi:N utilization substance protein A